MSHCRVPAEIVKENEDGTYIVDYINPEDSLVMPPIVEATRICKEVRKYRLIADKVNVRKTAHFHLEDTDIVCQLEKNSIAETVGEEVAIIGLKPNSIIFRLYLENGLGWITSR